MFGGNRKDKISLGVKIKMLYGFSRRRAGGMGPITSRIRIRNGVCIYGACGNDDTD